VGLACVGDAGAFTEWLSKNGASVSCSLRAGGGLTADKKLKEGEEACSIPTKICMTEETALKALGSKAEDLDAETQIALQLIYERARGSSSSYAPWLAMIPDREGLGMPLFWSAAERKILEGSSVLDETEELGEALEDEFKQVVFCSIPYVFRPMSSENVQRAVKSRAIECKLTHPPLCMRALQAHAMVDDCAQYASEELPCRAGARQRAWSSSWQLTLICEQTRSWSTRGGRRFCPKGR